MNRTCLAAAGIIASIVAGPHRAAAQQWVEPTGPNYHKIAVIDSVGLGRVDVSPNGKWMTFEMHGTIWIMPADGHAKPTPLLSPAHEDRMSQWFASGDGISFVSNRISRDGAARFYGMTVAVDPNTGRTVGPPRQVTTEEASFLSRPSPDGKWAVYLPPGFNVLKLIPATGGTPRTLATVDGAHAPITWSPDGKTVLFTVGNPGWLPPYGEWFKVSITGGSVTRVYPARGVMPYLSRTDHHVVLTPGTTEGQRIGRVELFDEKNQSLGAADVPEGMMPSFPMGATNGFYGVIPISQRSFHIIPTDGGASRAAPMPSWAWFYAWTADGLIVGGSERGNSFIALMDTAGQLLARAPLPAGAGAVGWEGAIGSVATFSPRRGSDDGDGNPLYIADARTGAIRELTAHSIGGGDHVQGRGGVPSVDDGRFLNLIANGSALELRTFATDGQSKLLRRFARTDSVLAFGVHGDRVAWAIKSSLDSIIVFSARGVNGSARRIVALRRVAAGHVQLAWSHDGSVLAWAGQSEPEIGFVRMDTDGAPTTKPSPLNARASRPWGMWWSKDDRALLVIASPTGERDEQMVRVPLNPAEAPTVLSKVEDDIGSDFVTLSPDGKHIASPDAKATGTSIWRVDFLPTGKKP